MEVAVAAILAHLPKKVPRVRGRIDVRLRPDQKTFIEKAAAIQGISVTEFILQNALENAMRTIREYETWTLERSDAELFLATLLNPPAPGTRLLRAAAQYKERYLQSE
jgi:uncharacterized protein (DUF1778 family)